MSIATKKALIDRAPIQVLVITIAMAVASYWNLKLAWFWLFGAWLPIWILLIFAALSWLIYLAPSMDAKPAKSKFNPWTGIPFYAWLILWLLHYAPAVHWPLFGSAA